MCLGKSWGSEDFWEDWTGQPGIGQQGERLQILMINTKQKYKLQLGQIRFANIKHKYFCSTVFRMAFLFHWICICMESINVFPRFGLRSPPAVGHFGDGWVGEEGFVIQIGANIASVINIIAKSQHHHQNHLHHRVASAIFNNSINSSIQILLFLRGLSKLTSNPKTSILNSWYDQNNYL